MVGMVLLACLTLPGADLFGSQILLGLRTRAIHLQEYWRGGKPYYAIANLTPSRGKLRMEEYSYSDDGVNFYDVKYGPILGEWNIESGEVIHVSARGVSDPKKLIHVTLDREPLGVLWPPFTRDDQQSAAITTYGGLNTGGRRDPFVWFEQSSLSFEPGDKVRLTLKIRPGPHKIGLGSYTGIWRMINGLATGEPDDVSFIPRLPLVGIECESLPINSVDGLHVIDTRNPIITKSVHDVKLTYVMPDDPASPIAEVLGFLWYGEGRNGRWFSRGILVDS